MEALLVLSANNGENTLECSPGEIRTLGFTVFLLWVEGGGLEPVWVWGWAGLSWHSLEPPSIITYHGDQKRRTLVCLAKTRVN